MGGVWPLMPSPSSQASHPHQKGAAARLYEQMSAPQPPAAPSCRVEPQQACRPCSALLQDVTIDDFPLPTLGPKLRALLREVTHGR